jgi:predicted glycoside hydrolase/deacetylase ChbG (UPF0249 family)
MTTPRRISICADDFAANEATSTAILELAGDRRISAVSCFSDSPIWQAAGPALREHRDQVLIGLHFNLTERFDSGRASLPGIILRSMSGTVDAAAVSRHLQRQIERFERVVGHPPDYIDGHEHVHALPVIRDVVAEVAAAKGGPIPVRDVGRFFGRTDAPLKRAVIRFLATHRARRSGRTAPVALNTRFAGDYSFAPGADYARLFADWLRAAPDRALIMCHPSAGNREHEFFRSPGYRELLERHAIRFLDRADLHPRSA